ncbi:MAG: hypothetical protein N3G19_02350 [Candidatus Pacearchaeota archaeon]|nr:hypothetical protein [Candidatus Pacearchaeota archaeon]
MEKERLIELRKELKRKKPEFVRKDSFKKIKLGKLQKKKRKWRRPKGRHSKIREKRKGYMRQPSIGWSSPKEIKGTIAGFIPRLIHNANELDLLKRDEIAIVGKVGRKKKIEIANVAIAKKITLFNLNAKKFIEKIRLEEKKKIEKKKEERKKEEKTGAEKAEDREKEKTKVEEDKVEK